MEEVCLSMPDIHVEYVQEIIKFSFKQRGDKYLHYGSPWINERS